MAHRRFEHAAPAAGRAVDTGAERAANGPDAAPAGTGATLLRLQQRYGNHHVQQVVAQARFAPVVQARLVLGPVDDPYEREAERVAWRVTSGATHTPAAPESRAPALQRFGAVRALAGEPGVQRAIQSARGAGTPLPDTTQEHMGQALGADFGGVRVHTDARADDLNRQLGARAFTTGQDIFFRRGEYVPGSMAGRHILAHELTHVVQQRSQLAAQAPDCTRAEQPTPAHRSADVLLQPMWDWRGAGIGAVAAGAAGALVGGTVFGPVGALIGGGLGAVAGGIPGGLLGGSAEDPLIDQTVVEPEEPFATRTNGKVGIGETLHLSVKPVASNRYRIFRRQFEWISLPGSVGGTLSSTDADGKATFTAGSTAGVARLSCRDRRSGRVFGSPTFQIVEPSGGRVEQQRGTKIWHKQSLWHVAFLANLYVLPDDVSFSAIRFQEGAATPHITGPWQAQRINHAAGRDETMFRADEGEGVNKVKTTDWVQSGTHSHDPTAAPVAPSQFVWQIPWYYKLGGTTKEFARIDHVAEDDGKGLARIRKDGSPWFEAHATASTGTWPFTPEQDVKDIARMFPGQMDAAIKAFLLANEIERTELVFADKEGHYPTGMTLIEALDIEKDIGEIFKHFSGLDSDTIGRIRKLTKPQRADLVTYASSTRPLDLAIINRKIDTI